MRYRWLPAAPEFRQPDWFGFAASGTNKGCCYLDDLSLHPAQ